MKDRTSLQRQLAALQEDLQAKQAEMAAQRQDLDYRQHLLRFAAGQAPCPAHALRHPVQHMYPYLSALPWLCSGRNLGYSQHLLHPWCSCLPCLKKRAICPGPISTCASVLKECQALRCSYRRCSPGGARVARSQGEGIGCHGLRAAADRASDRRSRRCQGGGIAGVTGHLQSRGTHPRRSDLSSAVAIPGSGSFTADPSPRKMTGMSGAGRLSGDGRGDCSGRDERCLL